MDNGRFPNFHNFTTCFQNWPEFDTTTLLETFGRLKFSCERLTVRGFPPNSVIDIVNTIHNSRSVEVVLTYNNLYELPITDIGILSQVSTICIFIKFPFSLRMHRQSKLLRTASIREMCLCCGPRWETSVESILIVHTMQQLSTELSMWVQLFFRPKAWLLLQNSPYLIEFLKRPSGTFFFGKEKWNIKFGLKQFFPTLPGHGLSARVTNFQLPFSFSEKVPDDPLNHIDQVFLVAHTTAEIL